METKPQKKSSTENFVKDIRNRTRRLFTSEQKILIVMEAIRGESPMPEICRKYGFIRLSSTDGIKSFLKPVKNGWPVIRPVKPLRTK